MKVVPQQKGDSSTVASINSSWESYGGEEYFGTLIALPKFLRVFRGKCQQIFNQRLYVYKNCNMSIGEILFFIISLTGIGFYFGFAYDSKQSGMATSIPLLLCMVFSIKNSFLLFICGICYERGIFWHKIFGWATLLGAILHAATAHHSSSSGWVVLGSLIFIMVFSLQPIRIKFYEIFIRFHWIGLIAIVVGIFMHKVVLGIIGFGYWGFDFIVKQIVIYRHYKNASLVEIKKVASNVIRVQILNNKIPFLSGQYVYICIPSISYFEWHPFGIQSSKGENKIQLFIKVAGNWTNSVCNLAATNPEGVMTRAYISGPHGYPSIDMQSDYYKCFIMIGGGIGVTPIISLTKSLIEQKLAGRPIIKMFLVWSTREKELYEEVMSDKYVKQLMANEPTQNPFFESFFHFSGGELKTDVEQSTIKETEEVSSRFIPSRPNMKEYMKKIQDIALANGEKHVGVLVCGPEKLITAIQHLSKDLSNSNVRFDVHEEVFIL